MSIVLAVDAGGTNIRVATVNAEGAILETGSFPARFSEKNISEKGLFLEFSSFLGNFLKEPHQVKAVGIGFPGFFIGNSGVLSSSPNLPNLQNTDIAGVLSDRLGLPVYAQNDALCAAIGEHRFGAGKGSKNLLHITLGTGIGGGLILDNTPYSGEEGMAMEFGHLRVAHDDSARSCGCGNTGCLEAYASATAIAARYFEETGTQTDAKDIYERACNGDQSAKEIIESAGSYVGAAIAEAVKLLDIHTITISGGLTGAWRLLHPAIVASLNTNLIPPLKGKINVLHSTLNDNAGLLGAAALVN